jgi:hypothetical protein
VKFTGERKIANGADAGAASVAAMRGGHLLMILAWAKRAGSGRLSVRRVLPGVGERVGLGRLWRGRVGERNQAVVGGAALK